MQYAIIENNTVVNIAVSDTALADNWVASDSAVIDDIYDNGQFTKPVPAPLTAADFDVALTAHLDATAQAKRYDNRITCMVRAGFAGPFQAEGQAFAAWGDTCNAFAYALMAEVLAGTAPMPASTADFVAMLPEMVWPA